MLQRDSGTTLDDLIEATGWLPHTTRTALTGLRKKGHELISEKVDGVRHSVLRSVTLEERIASVAAMSATERKTEWRRLHGTPAPPELGASLLARALAYRLQEKKLGGLTNAELRRLSQLGKKKERARARPTTPDPGSTSARPWSSIGRKSAELPKTWTSRWSRWPLTGSTP